MPFRTVETVGKKEFEFTAFHCHVYADIYWDFPQPGVPSFALAYPQISLKNLSHPLLCKLFHHSHIIYHVKHVFCRSNQLGREANANAI